MGTTRKSKKFRAPAVIRIVLADNVRRLRDVTYRTIDGETARNRALAKDAHTSLSQIQRILNRDLGPSIDGVEDLANAFGVQPRDMLTPYFGAPPEVRIESTDVLSDTGAHRVLKAQKRRA